MASLMKSRWADDEEEAAQDAQRKREKEAKKRAKAERQRRLDEVESQRQLATVPDSSTVNRIHEYAAFSGDPERSPKRRKLSIEPPDVPTSIPAATHLRFPAPAWSPCRHVDNFEKLNHIEEGSYGWVSRAKEVATGEVVALKKLKMDKSNDGFPVTGLREIQTLMASRHSNIVVLREVVMGDKLDEYAALLSPFQTSVYDG